MTDTIAHDTVAHFDGERAEELAALLDDYMAAKELVKEMKEQQSSAEAKIRALMGDANAAYIGEKLVATIATRNRSNIDRKALEAGWPDAIKACMTHTVYTVLDAKV